jgi:hypothetical protein
MPFIYIMVAGMAHSTEQSLNNVPPNTKNHDDHLCVPLLAQKIDRERLTRART